MPPGFSSQQSFLLFQRENMGVYPWEGTPNYCMPPCTYYDLLYIGQYGHISKVFFQGHPHFASDCPRKKNRRIVWIFRVPIIDFWVGYCSDITLSASLFFRITSSVTFSVFIYEGMAYNLMFLARVLPAVGKAADVGKMTNGGRD